MVDVIRLQNSRQETQLTPTRRPHRSPVDLVIIVLLASASVIGATAPAPPAPPQVFLDTHWQVPTGKSIVVGAGGNLQAAIDGASRGDEIVLQAGATFTGNFILRAKTGSGRIIIRSSQLATLPEGTRVSPSQVAAMATIVSANSMAVFLTEPGASGYRLAGLEMTIQNSVTLSYGIVVLGDGDATSAAQLPSDMIVDRSYIHGTSTCNCQRGVALNGIGEAVIDSYISDIHFDGVDSQAICGWAGPGPFKIVNNYLEAAGENILFGGAPPQITNLIPSDIEIRQNHINKPLAWMSPNPKLWTVKNLFELKNAQRMIVDGNLMENNWIEAQSGFAVLFQGIPQANTDLWSTVQDITFTNNVVRHSNSGFDFCGGCWYAASPDPGNSRVTRVYVANNLLDDINGPAYDGGTGAGGGLAFQILANTSDLVIAHNTVLNTGTLMVLDGKPSPRVSFVNNIASHGPWGITGSGLGSGNLAITTDLPDSTIAGNLIVGLQNTLQPQDYPAGNLFPSSMTAVGFTSYTGGNGGNYQLTSSSPYRRTGADSKDPGVDMTSLNAALPGVTSGGAASGNTLASCDLNQDGKINVIDVQLGTNQALGTAPCGTGDLNGDGRCTIVDVMRIVSSSLGAACNTAP